MFYQLQQQQWSRDDVNTRRRHNDSPDLYDVMTSSPYSTLGRRTLPRTSSVSSHRSMDKTRPQPPAHGTATRHTLFRCFTARSCDCMSSVRLSVCNRTLEDQDHMGWESSKIIARTLIY